MSHLEQALHRLLSRRPEIEKCYRAGLINRRALARYLVRVEGARPDQVESTVAMIRRHDFGETEADAHELFQDARIALKDGILILDFEKEKALLPRLERVIRQIDYDRGDTLKVVVGTASIKLFLDRKKEGALRPSLAEFRLRGRLDRLSEISMLFPEAASATRGVLSVICRELALHDVVITELLTASPELLLYVRGDQVARAYDVLRDLQAERPSPPRRRSAPESD